MDFQNCQPSSNKRKPVKRSLLAEFEECAHILKTPRNHRRTRTVFTATQLSILQKHFTENPYPDIIVRQQLKKEIGVNERKIQVWFQNRRARCRKGLTDTEKAPPKSS